MTARLVILAAMLTVAGASLLPDAARVTLAVTVPGGVDHSPPGGHD